MPSKKIMFVTSIVIISIIMCVSAAYAATVSHGAGQIKPGSFQSGNYSFPSGYVGIGTASPNQELVVADDSGNTGLAISGSGDHSRTLGLWSAGKAWQINHWGSASGNKMVFNYNNGSEWANHIGVTTDGELGIGTTGPGSPLHIYRDIGSASTPTRLATIDAVGTATGNGFGGSLDFLSSNQVGQDGFIAARVASAWEQSNNVFGLALYTNSGGGGAATEKVRITGTGNVGIGTTSPQKQLHIQGSLAGIRLSPTQSGAEEWIIQGDSGPAGLVFYNVNDTLTRMIIDNSGNVGIGTIAPGNKLEVVGTVNATAFAGDGSGLTNLPVSSQWDDVTGGINYAGGNVSIGTTSPARRLHVSVTDGTPAARFEQVPGIASIEIIGNAASASDVNFGDSGDADIGRVRYNHGDNSMRFRTNNDERVRITSTGNVGIGTMSPTRKVEVNFTGSTVGMKLTRGDVEGNSLIEMANTAGVKATMGWNQGLGAIEISDGSNQMVMKTGKVGINTTSPQATLDVNGAIYQRGSSLHSDYVFEEGYELESIEEHSEFMWENKHLPAVPKAMKDESGQDIVDVGQQRRGMLEEVEKSHVYIEQLNAEIKGLKDEVNTLKGLVCADHPDSDVCR